MIENFVRSVIGGFLAPRRTVRMLIDRAEGLVTALLLVLLAHLLTGILQILTPGTGALRETGFLPRHLSGLIVGFAWFFILSGLAFFAGRAAGGVATRVHVQVAIGWHFVLASFMTPVMARLEAIRQTIDLTDPEAPVPPELLQGWLPPATLAVSFLYVWLLAQCIAEAHRFKSALGTFFIVVVAALGIAMMVISALGAAQV